VIFTRGQMRAFEQLRASLEAELAARNAPARQRAPQQVPADPAAQLRKLEELRQSGLISEQEYAAKREEIINRL
jgi:Short C-terminal domain